VFNQHENVKQLSEGRPIIAFTAVAANRDFVSVEREVLGQLGFKVLNYFITAKKEDKDPEFDEQLHESAEQTL